ncbi:MAG: 4-alpha-glucanotransferase, partial [Spirochaetota bacterium]
MYNSLPYNASDTLYEQAYQGAWRPFLSGLYKFPSIKAVIHFPGNIFAWIEQNHPEYLYLLIEMVRKGQIELLGGGFYSPLAPLVSTQDMTGQVEALSA